MVGLEDARAVLDALVRDAAYFSDEIRVHSAWVESPNSVCVIYERFIDGGVILGRRIIFPPHARESDPASTGSDAVELLREPAWSVSEHYPTDEDGVFWLIPATDRVPITPPES
ncbi:hypothetical protein [Microbacterium indicum]|uniref:hypothetical protein n=1 Tax=Microbacterium indicum TaxID=358100 RepID=UPI0012EC76EA|nr:hypothetical protein [Microbacterium indicum]